MEIDKINLCTLLTILVFINFFIMYKITRGSVRYTHPHITNDITCYNEALGDTLPELSEAPLQLVRNIFFVETSCKGYLDSRQACAVESAARAHPDWQINLLFVGPVKNKTLSGGVLNTLQSYPNVVVSRVNLSKIVKESPLERIITENLLLKSRFRVSHTSDILRYLLLWKFGGVYIDLDIIVLKSFNSLARDFTGLDTPYSVAAGVMGMSQSIIGRKISLAAVSELGSTFNTVLWGGNGPGVIRRVLYQTCDTKNITNMTAEICQGFEVYDPEVFYPVPFAQWPKFFRSGTFNMYNSYTVHIWNKYSYQQWIRPDSLYADLAKRFCPSVYKLYGDVFGRLNLINL